jgi:hypothetical protein
MKKITQLMRDAFISGTPFKRDNTEVVVNEFGVSIYLFGNKIAFRSDYKGATGSDFMVITTCGWPTRTTKERLNALPNVHISQLKGMWYLNGNRWDGSGTTIDLI